MSATPCGFSFVGNWKQSKFLWTAVDALLVVACVASVGAAAPTFPAPSSQELKIYFVDVEGGQATLFVTPAGQSLLIDTGWDGNNGRDADRIVAAAKNAGVHKIDYVLITHFHEDHVGGLPQLVARIPVGTFLDHGDNRELYGRDVTQREILTGQVARPAVARPLYAELDRYGIVKRERAER